jgi:hypothetical protein
LRKQTGNGFQLSLALKHLPRAVGLLPVPNGVLPRLKNDRKDHPIDQSEFVSFSDFSPGVRVFFLLLARFVSHLSSFLRQKIQAKAS